MGYEGGGGGENNSFLRPEGDVFGFAQSEGQPSSKMRKGPLGMSAGLKKKPAIGRIGRRQDHTKAISLCKGSNQSYGVSPPIFIPSGHGAGTEARKRWLYEIGIILLEGGRRKNKVWQIVHEAAKKREIRTSLILLGGNCIARHKGTYDHRRRGGV